MGAGAKFVHKRTRGGRQRWVIDFVYLSKDGVRKRYHRDAQIQTSAGAHAEADDRVTAAHRTGDPRLERELMSALREEESARPAAMTVNDFLKGDFEKLFLPTCRPSTVVRYRAILRRHVVPAFGATALRAVDDQVIFRFEAQLRADEVKPRAAVNMLRTVLTQAVKFKVIAEAPKLPKGFLKASAKLPSAPSDEELSAILEKTGGWIRTAAALGALAGLRMGEVRALEVGDVDFSTGFIHVRRAFSEDEVMSPKGDKEREVPMTPELSRTLRASVKSKLPRARVVVDEEGETPTRQQVLHVFVRTMAKQGLRRRSFHSLRHYFCSTLIRRGASLEAVRVLAGHSSLQVTQRYVHATDRDLRSAIGLLA